MQVSKDSNLKHYYCEFTIYFYFSFLNNLFVLQNNKTRYSYAEGNPSSNAIGNHPALFGRRAFSFINQISLAVGKEYHSWHHIWNLWGNMGRTDADIHEDSNYSKRLETHQQWVCLIWIISWILLKIIKR